VVHLSEVVTGWSPTSWVSGSSKLVSALAAIATAAVLVRVIPKVSAIARARDLLQRDLDSNQVDLEALARDVVSSRSELHATVRALRIARDDAEQASRAKSDLLSLVSHEVRTPMMRLEMQVQRLRQELSTSLPTRDSVEKVRDAASRLVSVVGDLIAFAELQSDGVALRLAKVDLSEAVRRVVEELSPLAASRMLELRFEPGRDRSEIVTDRQLVQLVVRHLMANAVEHTARGSVTVTVGARSGGALSIAISDTGPGIAPELKERMFEPFLGTESTAFKEKAGLGLGLAIVRRAVDALGGQVELRTEPDVGSTFTVVLPSRAVPATEQGDARPGRCR
jgi:signal transduction histidine kinase